MCADAVHLIRCAERNWPKQEVWQYIDVQYPEWYSTIYHYMDIKDRPSNEVSEEAKHSVKEELGYV